MLNDFIVENKTTQAGTNALTPAARSPDVDNTMYTAKLSVSID